MTDVCCFIELAAGEKTFWDLTDPGAGDMLEETRLGMGLFNRS